MKNISRNRKPFITFLEKIYNKFRIVIKKQKFQLCIYGLVLNFIVGLVILYYSNTLKQYLPHLILLTITNSTSLFIARSYIDTLKYLEKEFIDNYRPENIELIGLFKRLSKKTISKTNWLICFGIIVLFLWGILSQDYICLNLVGIYAVFIVCASVFVSVLGYMQYLYVLWFLFRVSKCSQMHYNVIFPAQTPFLVKIATLLQQAKWIFFIQGFSYTFEYFILIPKGNVTIKGIKMPDNLSFLTTWIFILIVIVLAFPIIVIFQEHTLTKIIKNLKRKQIEYLHTQYQILCQNTSAKQEATNIYLYQSIIGSVIASADYPLKIQKLGPILLSIVTTCIHIINLLNQLPLNNILINQ